MRVSNRQMASILNADILRNSTDLLNIQERVSTGKLVNRPSDDPIGAGKILDYRRSISAIDQYNTNITSAKNRTEFTDTLLDNLHDLLTQAKQIAAEHLGGQTEATLREGAAKQVEGIYDQVFAIANTKFNGAYLFSGHKTDTRPFEKDDDLNTTYNGDSGEIDAIVGEGAVVKINLTGNEVFTGVDATDGTNIFDDLKALKEALEAEPFDPSAISDLSDNLARGVAQVKSAAAEQSITYKRLETAENHWNKFKNSLEDLLSSVEDADLAQTIVELRAQETAYEASLATAAKIFDKKSLVDFLR